MKVTVTLIIIGALETIPKVLEDVEIRRQAETIHITALSR